MSDRRLVAVHAHPDDECISTGGILAKYAAERAHVCLVTCTNGEVGEIAELPELPSPDELRPRLGEFRQGELREACAVLGLQDLRLLGYHDSGMEGTPENEAAHAFVNQDLDEVVGRMVAVLREVRPQVTVTYNEFGFYGHPDHIMANKVTLAAVEAAADPARYPQTGDPWRVAKLYYTAIPLSRMLAAAEIFGTNDEGGPPFDEEWVRRVATPDELVTTQIDVTPYVHRKFEALAAHRTQRGTTEWFLSIPPEIREAVMNHEFFVLVNRGPGLVESLEADLFEGVGQ